MPFSASIPRVSASNFGKAETLAPESTNNIKVSSSPVAVRKSTSAAGKTLTTPSLSKEMPYGKTEPPLSMIDGVDSPGNGKNLDIFQWPCRHLAPRLLEYLLGGTARSNNLFLYNRHLFAAVFFYINDRSIECLHIFYYTLFKAKVNRDYSTVTDFAKLRGLSGSKPWDTAM